MSARPGVDGAQWVRWQAARRIRRAIGQRPAWERWLWRHLFAGLVARAIAAEDEWPPR